MAEVTMDRLRKIATLDVDRAFEGIGDEEIYLECVKDYYITLAENREKIKQDFINKDIKNYVIRVHGMKSASRLIGAFELGDLAYKLEMSGKDNDLDTINAETGRLILMMCNLEEELAKVFDSDTSDKAEISEEELVSLFKDIVSAAEVFDFDVIDDIMSRLEDYSIPESYKEKYNKLRIYVADVARDDIICLIG